jgi:hypothetical protein
MALHIDTQLVEELPNSGGDKDTEGCCYRRKDGEDSMRLALAIDGCAPVSPADRSQRIQANDPQRRGLTEIQPNKQCEGKGRDGLVSWRQAVTQLEHHSPTTVIAAVC